MVILCTTTEIHKQVPIKYLTIVIILSCSVSQESGKQKKSSHMEKQVLDRKERDVSIAYIPNFLCLLVSMFYLQPLHHSYVSLFILQINSTPSNWQVSTNENNFVCTKVSSMLVVNVYVHSECTNTYQYWKNVTSKFDG
jgi:hypothetical protein